MRRSCQVRYKKGKKLVMTGDWPRRVIGGPLVSSKRWMSLLRSFFLSDSPSFGFFFKLENSSYWELGKLQGSIV